MQPAMSMPTAVLSSVNFFVCIRLPFVSCLFGHQSPFVSRAEEFVAELEPFECTCPRREVRTSPWDTSLHGFFRGFAAWSHLLLSSRYSFFQFRVVAPLCSFLALCSMVRSTSWLVWNCFNNSLCDVVIRTASLLVGRSYSTPSIVADWTKSLAYLLQMAIQTPILEAFVKIIWIA